MHAPAKSPAPDGERRRVDQRRVLVAAARVVWLAVAVLGGGAFGSALEGRSDAVQLTASIGLWALWALVALAMLVPSTLSLTVARVIVPASVVAAVVAALAGQASITTVAGIALALLMSALVVSAEFGEAFAQGSAYGDERRFPLRPPAAALPPLVLSWCVLCGATIAGPLLVASGSLVAGLPLTALAIAAVSVLGRRFHRFAQRWLVLVPAGVVIHDHVVLVETAMFLRPSIVSMHLAFVDTGAADLTGPAAGHAVEIELRESATVVLDAGRRTSRGKALHASAVLVAPTRPGRLLREAAARRFPVG